MKKYPSVTVAMLSYNDEQIISNCLKSIREQNYPGKVEILIADGGSTDKTISIAKKYKARIKSWPEYKNNPDKRGEIILKLIKTEIALIFSADNRFQEKNCLRAMIEPFSDPEISAVETFRYGFDQNDHILTKYFALIGGSDPVAVALGKADRAPYDVDKWNSFGKAETTKNYFKVTFENDINKIPTLGANGFAIRNSLLQKFSNKDSLHTDLCLRLIESGYDKFAFVRNYHIIHDASLGLKPLLMRKLTWRAIFSKNKTNRKHTVYNYEKDILKLIIIIFSFSTLIVPTIRAIKGCLKYRSTAWFLHPFISFIFLVTYGLHVILGYRIAKRDRPNKK